jgi:arylformamidase
MLIDLSHRITDGMITYPGLPAPVIGTHLSREAAEELYGPGITFHIGLLTLCTNTGTYIDVPFHRYADGHDLADLALEQVAGLPAVVLDRRGIDSRVWRAMPCWCAPITPSTSAPRATSRRIPT